MYAKQIYGFTALLGVVLFANLIWLAPNTGQAPPGELINRANISQGTTSQSVQMSTPFVPQLSPFAPLHLKAERQGNFDCKGCDLEQYS